MNISAEEHEVLSFFEVAPILRDPEEPWYTNDSVYEVIRGNLSLSCAIDPLHKDARIILNVDHEPVYEWNATDLEDIRYRNEDSRECLEFIISNRASIRLAINPKIRIDQRLLGET